MTVTKESALLVSEPLTHIINLFIQHGIVPDEMKIAREISIFKPDDQSLFTNYQKSFNAIPDEFQHPSSNQYGFRKLIPMHLH